MLIDENRCKKCNNQIEVFQKLNDKPPTRCKKCGGRLEKMVSTSAIQFKGEGWYVTDYARKGSVAEKVEKELSSPESTSNDKSSTDKDDKSSGDKDDKPSTDKEKSKKSPAKKSDKA